MSIFAGGANKEISLLRALCIRLLSRRALSEYDDEKSKGSCSLGITFLRSDHAEH